MSFFLIPMGLLCLSLIYFFLFLYQWMKLRNDKQALAPKDYGFLAMAVVIFTPTICFFGIFLFLFLVMGKG